MNDENKFIAVVFISLLVFVIILLGFHVASYGNPTPESMVGTPMSIHSSVIESQQLIHVFWVTKGETIFMWDKPFNDFPLLVGHTYNITTLQNTKGMQYTWDMLLNYQEVK